MLRSRRGFTLIEAMVTVIIVGILSLVAILGYRRVIHRAYLAEAQDMVSTIRKAQEAFRAENGGYLDVSLGLGPGYDYPLPTPGKSKTAWGGTCTTCQNPATGWSALNVASGAPLAFGYSTRADNKVGPPSFTIMVNGQAFDMTQMSAPWYVVEADGDLDGNGLFCSVFGFSHTNQLFVNQEGE
jgi:prepilin-type N-terminal cleavage/methylation domain-containing protein